MNDDLVLFERREPGTGLITLNVPDRLNAWSGAMAREFFAAIDRCVADDEVRVIVLTGAGRGFCAGADMEALNAIRAAPAQGASGPMGSRRFDGLMSVPKPVIAAINGACAGVGFVLALFCDLRFAADGAKITSAFSRRGLVAEYGSSWILPRLVGTARAFDILLSGRVLLGSEAAAMGLVNESVPAEQLMEHTLEYAADLAANASPTSWAIMKRQVHGDWMRDVGPATDDAIRLMDASVARADFQEGVQSYLDRRPPAFPPFSGSPGQA
jgi:enoyl-CoA hydratase/carnithine racemase